MATFHRDSSSTTYIIAKTKKKATTFAKKKGLTDYVAIGSIEDVPRENGLDVITVGNDYWLHPDYELMFGPGGLFLDYRANIYRDNEVPACH